MVYNLTECAALFFAYAAMGWFMEVLYMGVRGRKDRRRRPQTLLRVQCAVEPPHPFPYLFFYHVSGILSDNFHPFRIVITQTIPIFVALVRNP